MQNNDLLLLGPILILIVLLGVGGVLLVVRLTMRR